MKKKLFQAKRILAMTLAAVMTITGIPMTANASTTDNVVVSEDVTSNDAAVVEVTAEGENATKDVYEIKDELTEAAKTAVYTGNAGFDISEGSTVRNGLSLYLNGVAVGNLAYNDGVVSNVTYTWQEEKDGAYANMAAGTEPVNAGNYKLVVELPATETYDAAKAEVLFTITKAPVHVYIGYTMPVPGSLVKDFEYTAVTSNDIKSFNYIVDDATTVDVNEATNSEIALTVNVCDAFSKEVLAADTKFVVNNDYVIVAEAAFTDKVTAEDKANFEVQPIAPIDLEVHDLIRTQILLTYTGQEEDGYISKLYNDGNPIEIAATEYTAKVALTSGKWEEDTFVYDELAGATVSVSWQDQSYNDLEGAPTEVGSYYLVISYAGEEGVYAESYARIPVIVNPKPIVVRPVMEKDAADKDVTIYSGMTVKEVLSHVDYKVWDVSAETEEELLIDRLIFWGNDDEYNRTQPYQPVFELQEIVTVGTDEKEQPIYEYYTLSDSDVISSAKSYRVIFSGNKAIYRDNGNKSNENSVNYASNGSNTSYTVKIDAESLEKNVLALTVDAGKVATIDVSALLKDGAGVSFDKPITKTYDGNGIYTKRSEYKLAVVKDAEGKSVVSNTDAQISYDWYYMSGTEMVYDETTSQYVEQPTWDYSSYYVSPNYAGNYKLVISYKDAENVYHAQPAEVYYYIDPLKVKVVPTGKYEAWTETSVGAFDTNQIAFDIYTVDAEGKLGQKLDWDKEGYTVYWDIQKAVKNEAGEEEYVSAYGEVFEKDVTYRIAVSELEMDWYVYYHNFVNYMYVQEGTGEDAVLVQKYLNDVTVPISLNIMGSTEITLTVDETKLTPKTKVYDGTPFDISAALAAGLVQVKDANGAVVSDVNLTYTWFNNNTYEFVEEPVDAGNYTLYASFAGNATYKAIPQQRIVDIEITKKEVTVNLSLRQEVIAGTYAHQVAKDYLALEFDGLLEEDAADFEGSRYLDIYDNDDDGEYNDYIYFYPAVDYYTNSIYNANGNRLGNYELIYSNTDYTAKCTSITVENEYSKNYTFKGAEFTFTAKRGISSVSSVSNFGVRAVQLKDVGTDMLHEITPLEGIPHSSFYLNGEYFSGNYVIIQINGPLEYRYGYTGDGWAMYKNSIEKAGGYVISSNTTSVTAMFKAGETDYEFEIRWEDDYKETFKLYLKDAVVLPDLSLAESPKKISFISPAKKMVVGATQALDVNVVKEQESDIINLNYKSSDEEILSVDEWGYVTALKPGKATITVYPVRWVDGEQVEIEGGKTASVQITVSEVTAPKITKVDPIDTSAYVYFTNPSDGFRVETYVLEGANRTVTEFEEAIASMKNGYWKGIFATNPAFSCYYGIWLSDLKANTDYTVYVRNVSDVRILSDGSMVSNSFAGVTNSFKTTKPHATGLEVFFKESQATYNYDTSRYEVPLSQKTAAMSVNGFFPLSIEKDDAAEAIDYDVFELPLKKEDQAFYVNPKLTYFVANRTTTRPASYYVYVDDYYYYKTDIASVDKKGKIKLNGVGSVYVLAYDLNTGRVSYPLTLNITANADQVAKKTTKLLVGQSVALDELLVYKEGNKVLTGSYATAIKVDDALIKAFEESEAFVLNADTLMVTAVKAGKLDVELTDMLVEAAGGIATAKATLQASDLQPVKNLKAVNVTDQYFDIQFAHVGFAEAFRIEVSDARGKLLRSAYVKEDFCSMGNNTYTYRVTGLTQSSKYNFTVTALYGDVSSKVAKKSVKTTKLPISYVSLNPKQYGGINIVVCNEDYGYNSISAWSLQAGNKYTLSVSGSLVNQGAIDAKTDTLTWTSSNKKVATIKANAGTDTATLKVLKSGTTVIEVKSKITKAVVARYQVYTYPVGAANGYYGDNEPLYKNWVSDNDASNVQSITVGQSFDVSLNAGEYQWFSFTAPTNGTYQFYAESDIDTKAWAFGDYNANWVSNDDFNSNCIDYSDDAYDMNFCYVVSMDAGETIYFVASDYGVNDGGDFTVYMDYY